jgi:hypothetical protein
MTPGRSRETTSLRVRTTVRQRRMQRQHWYQARLMLHEMAKEQTRSCPVLGTAVRKGKGKKLVLG